MSGTVSQSKACCVMDCGSVQGAVRARPAVSGTVGQCKVLFEQGLLCQGLWVSARCC